MKVKIPAILPVIGSLVCMSAGMGQAQEGPRYSHTGSTIISRVRVIDGRSAATTHLEFFAGRASSVRCNRAFRRTSSWSRGIRRRTSPTVAMSGTYSCVAIRSTGIRSKWRIDIRGLLTPERRACRTG